MLLAAKPAANLSYFSSC